MPEPHSRFTVLPAMLVGSPASSEDMRATLRLSSPAWFAQPKTTSSIAAQSTLVLRSMRALIGTAPRSSARTAESEPP
jgi:hypothetical protein